MLKRIDTYIIKKYLGTFFFSITIIISIAIVLDISEKIDDFITTQPSLYSLVFDYYLNFIPYYSNMLAPLFSFISVIYFTSKMASDTEIIAMFCSGISLKRLIRPYFIAAALIMAIFMFASNFIIPHSNFKRYNFEEKYVAGKVFINREGDVHRQIKQGKYIYLKSYNNYINTGYKFSIEEFSNSQLKAKLLADSIIWNENTKSWKICNYYIRHINGLSENIVEGTSRDTVFDFTPDEFNFKKERIAEFMNYGELKDFISKQQFRGENTVLYEVELYKRTAIPFAIFILTLIGIALASRKIRGASGANIGIGLLLSFSYIVLLHISTTFAVQSTIPPLVSVWIPNFIYGSLSIVLIAKTQR